MIFIEWLMPVFYYLLYGNKGDRELVNGDAIGTTLRRSVSLWLFFRFVLICEVLVLVARKVLKRINVISELKKKSKKQPETLEQGKIDDQLVVPTVHVESLRSRRSSSNSNQAESQNLNSELIDKVALSIKEGKVIFL